jgi:hypothetical protein
VALECQQQPQELDWKQSQVEDLKKLEGQWWMKIAQDWDQKEEQFAG